MKKRLSILLSAIFLSAALGLACSRNTEVRSALHEDMRDAYTEARTLYGYVWSQKLFDDPRSEKAISSALEALGRDFHRAEIDAPLEAFEPGFRIALFSQQKLLQDAGRRFREGQKDYARWRLRGMATNCIACHSRYHAPVNFFGDLPPAEESSPETIISQGEFLFATRQFEQASDTLFHAAEQFSDSAAGWHYQFQALKLWLVIEVRTKNIWEKSALKLERYLNERKVPSNYAATIGAWVNDLRKLQNEGHAPAEAVDYAKDVLSGLSADSTVDADERNLVRTLFASSLLHQLLLQSPASEVRRKSSLLLGTAYYHIPITILEPFAEQYLEITIRDFPHTLEAHAALVLLEARLRSSTGVAERDLSPEQIKNLTELRKLADPGRADGSEPSSATL